MPEQPISGVDATSSKSLDTMIFMISAKDVVQQVGVQAMRLQTHKVSRLSVNPKNRGNPV
eukprot:4188269-Amphidinium_carterae.1